MTLTELPPHLRVPCPRLAELDAIPAAMERWQAELAAGAARHLAEHLAPLPTPLWPAGCDITLGADGS